MDMYGNVWKCTEMYRNGQKLMEIVIVFFWQFFPFFVVWKMYGKPKEFYGKSMEVYGHAWKCMEKSKFVKSMEMYGKSMEI